MTISFYCCVGEKTRALFRVLGVYQKSWVLSEEFIRSYLKVLFADLFISVLFSVETVSRIFFFIKLWLIYHVNFTTIVPEVKHKACFQALFFIIILHILLF